MTLRVAELEALFTADIRPFEQAAVKVEARRKGLTKAPTEVKVDADVKGALAGMDRVEAAGKRLVSQKTALEVDAAIGKAEKNLAQIRADLDELRRGRTTPEVSADITKAEKALSSAEVSLDALKGMRAEMIVEADTSQAEGALDGVADKAEDAGTDGGRRGGKGMVVGIVGALAAIPIAGAIVGIAKSAGEAVVDGFRDGLQVEVRSDMLAARTGLDPATVGRLARAAGDAYASNFGESLDANMDTARAAVETKLLDPAATQRDSQQIIESLSGVADLLGEDIPRVARSTAQLLRTGLAENASQAFDLIVKGQQAGLNVSEDWLDTLDEYSTQWRKLGLQGPQVLGLLAQGVKAGARDTDVAADALKEFSIRAIDGSKTTKEGFKAIGLSAKDMADKIARGGPEAADALGLTLDKLREVKDPTDQAAAAVALFGTQAEDLGAALYAMDLSTAVEQIGSVDGAAQRALSTLGDNAAGKVESAKRNIEVAADGIKGALAEAFSPQIEGFAEFVSENREAVIKFLLEMADGALGFGIAVVEGAAAGTEALGNFAGGIIADVIDALADMAVAVDHSLPGDQHAKAFREWADGAIDNLKRFDEGTESTADQIREKLITNTLEPAREKLNQLGDGLLTNAALTDATNRLANDIADVGYNADGSKASIDLLNGSLDTSTESGRLLDGQIRAVRDGLLEQARAAVANGESQDEVRSRVLQARQAFLDQMTAMGLTQDQAAALADQYGLIPETVETDLNATDHASPKVAEAQANIDGLHGKTVDIKVNWNAPSLQAALGLPRTGSGTVLAPGLATGGAVTGPGGPRDDVIPAWLSNGEHVIPADEVEKAGGQGAIYRLRQALRSGVARFASGGAVGRWEKERDTARAEAERAWAAASAAWSRGDDAAWRDWDKKWKAADERYRTAVANLAKVRAEGSEVAQEARRGNLAGTASQSLSGAYRLVDQVAAAGGDELLSKSQRSSQAKAAASAEKEYRKLYGTLDKVTAQLDAAREKADALRQVAKDAADQVSAGFTLTGQGDLLAASTTTNVWGETSSSSPSASSIGQGVLARAKAYKTKAQALASKLAALVKKGLPYRLVDEVLQYGVDGGAIEAADGLLALSSGDLASLKATYAQIDKTAASIGNTMAGAYSPGGIAAADAAVKAAEKSQDKVVAALDGLGTRLENALLGAYGGKRAGGGPVSAGVAYTVGERGQETFIAPSNGTILPNGTGLVAQATFSEAQVRRFEAALERGAARGIADFTAAQDREATYL